MTIIFNPDKLAWTAEELQAQYRNAVPFPHIAVDDFLSSANYAILLGDFPTPEVPLWHKFDGTATAHNTVFKVRPREVKKPAPKERMREWIPPAILTMTRGMRNKASGAGK